MVHGVDLFDRSFVTDRLARARREGLLVTLVRRARDMPRVTGYVVDVSDEWVVLAALDERFSLDGLSVFRVRAIRTVAIEPDADCVEAAVLRARNQWPPNEGLTIDPRSIESILDSVPFQSVVGVTESGSDTRYVVGVIARTDPSSIWVRCISRRGRWKGKLKAIQLDDIVRINIGCSYEAACLLAAQLEVDGRQIVDVQECRGSSGDSAGTRATVLDDLERAMGEILFVNVHRWDVDADQVDGFVVGIGTTWVALARVGPDLNLDGWALLRLRDVRKVVFREVGERRGLESRALRSMGLWPPTRPDLQLDDDLPEVIGSLAALSPVLVAYREYCRPDVCWVGEVITVDQQTLTIRALDPRAEWELRPRMIDAADLSRVELGGGYELALKSVAMVRP